MARLLDSLRLYACFAGASIRSQMQYRTTFAIRTVADFLVIITDFVPIYILVRAFGGLGEWSFPELALLYGMVALSWGVVEGALFGFENFGPFLIAGQMDRWLLRPRSVILQVAGHQFEIRKLGRTLQAGLVLAVAGLHLELGLAGLAWVGLGIAGGVLFFTGVVLLGAATQFWTLGHTQELQNMLTYGGSAALSYPISIYTAWFRRVFTYGIPLAFVNYFPAIAALGRTASEGWPTWLPWLSPLACLALLLAGLGLFARGMRRYESTGS